MLELQYIAHIVEYAIFVEFVLRVVLFICNYVSICKVAPQTVQSYKNTIKIKVVFAKFITAQLQDFLAMKCAINVPLQLLQF